MWSVLKTVIDFNFWYLIFKTRRFDNKNFKIENKSQKLLSIQGGIFKDIEDNLVNKKKI